ncbi:CvpA family protein [Treponema ruminis]|uniref:Membrane protein required for colicin V production n=1 Tax=Treponema ruminis TaxID=744515 RepID=A0A7W8G7K4_9SPIR|nr:CvpA family protein [Treponema ruminis]MBB5225296.1 membrane protein required for colicin V production [Treponema ruminis]QSI01833.1 CvpA family protein [Treponema ruminis]
MTFTFIDIVFLIIIFSFAFLAMIHGLIQELFGKLALIVGLVAGFYFCGLLAPHISKIIKIPAVDVVLAFILIFITAFLVVKIIQIIVGAIFSGEIMKSLDRVLGFAFGAIEGVLIVSCILILMKAQIWFNLSPLLSKSTVAKILLPYLQAPISYIGGMLV